MAIVLLEDEPMLRRALTRALGCFDVTLLVADTLHHAAEYFEHTRVDLLVTDYSLGEGRNVVQLLGELRESQPECVVFLMTGHAPETLEVAASLYHEFIQKPFTIKALRELVRAYLGPQELKPRAVTQPKP